jgi:hypothetical protein
MSGQVSRIDSGPDRGTPRVVLACDVAGCRATIAATPAATLAYARAIASRRAWRHVLLKRRQGGPSSSIDLCPDHAAIPVEQMPQPLSPHWRRRRSA